MNEWIGVLLTILIWVLDYYCPSIYIRHNEKGWFIPVHLWDISKEEICGQVCLGLESPLIFKPESDADNSCSFSAF